ncbi:alpha-amylase [Reinekea blandensis]|uniref:Periplasmic alpha-amylase n=1 Tax=Reinekea blandensis MED297 TaxID=314283 RepID=A4BF32_9GAMM|nr:alpha-amylase [Reinekea blandensis]EAR09367.1 periplasmic alpha-amylase precursor [Reinekea sp. MED297] [Reinekea blandensis MED297]
MRFPALPFGLLSVLMSPALLAATLTIEPVEPENRTVIQAEFTDGLAEQALEKGSYRLHVQRSGECAFDLGGSPDTRVRFNRPIPLTACAEAPLELKVRVPGSFTFTLDAQAPSLTLTFTPQKTASTPFRRPLPETQCNVWTGGPVTVDVQSVFNDGEVLRDYYSGHLAEVVNGQVTLTPAKGSNGLLLLERAEHQPSAFSWDNLTVYFVMTDRFHNGDPSNDHSFGRQSDGKEEIGTFHGGDIRGLIDKLDYIEALGANAIWMTPLVEQVHGFVGGGENGDFPFYAYHGYWALDYTRLDPNFGTDADLRELVQEAHRRDIRLIWDAVINHAGYATGQDLVDFDVDAFKAGERVDNQWQPSAGQTWHSFHDAIDYNSTAWNADWWNSDWVRGSFPGYEAPGGDDLTMALAGLPDFRTESSEPVGLPPILLDKADSRAMTTQQTVAEHLIDWQAYWVREYGIDAFRVDTAKHVELERWSQLKQAATEALRDWKSDNGDQALDDSPFWMVGEVFDHPLYKDYYYDAGFDSLINFEFQEAAHELALCMNRLDETFQRYANTVNADPDFNALTYISSHDTTLFYAKYQSLELQKRVAAPFLLLPGGVQIYYGDESGRPLGPYGDDFHQGTRSDMNWEDIKDDRAELLNHWKILGQFRNRHVAIGAGTHRKISDSPYVFSRQKDDDSVVIVFAGNEAQ